MERPHTQIPMVYMLCGISGSGKTTAAMTLVARGCVRLSVDQLLFDRHGRAGTGFELGAYRRLHEAIIAELDQRLPALLREGQDVVLDYGLEFWTRASRERYKRLIEDHGASWTLFYLRASRETLLERLTLRNSRQDANANFISEAMLDTFIAWFEEPADEQQQVWDQSQLPPPARSATQAVTGDAYQSNQ